MQLAVIRAQYGPLAEVLDTVCIARIRRAPGEPPEYVLLTPPDVNPAVGPGVLLGAAQSFLADATAN